jgi:mannosylglycerate hydrolase
LALRYNLNLSGGEATRHSDKAHVRGIEGKLNNMSVLADKPLETATKTLVVVSHTHWDREWYLPYQNFRFKLVKLIDNLLDLLDNSPDFRYFTLDGQTIVIEDYLEIRPEREEDLRRHVASGRLLIGPWYILPDQFLVSGEAHIQNMLRGLAVSRKYGDPMKVGYIPDPFGHISQMPQILRGFGFDTAVFWRGVGKKITQNEFIWQAPDGSEVEALHLPGSKNIGGYSTGLAFNGGVDVTVKHLNGLNFLINRSGSGYVLVMNGNDHVEPSQDLPQTLREAEKRLQEKGKNLKLVHGTMPMFFELARQTDAWQDPKKTPLHVGEFRDCEIAHLLPGVLSARMWIKQTNSKLENTLERETGPLVAWNMTLPQMPLDYNVKSLHSMYKTAWKYLLQNDPHDSICGCSVDAVHEEMKTRYTWVDQINGEIKNVTLTNLVRQIDTVGAAKNAGVQEGEDATAIVLFNPLPLKRTESAIVVVSPNGGVDSFVITDESGEYMPYKILKIGRDLLFRMDIAANTIGGMSAQVDPEGKVMGFAMTNIEFRLGETMNIVEIEITAVANSPVGTDPKLMQYTLAEIDKYTKSGVDTFKLSVYQQSTLDIAFWAKDMPAHGYKTFILRPRREDEPIYFEQVSKDEGSIENEFYEIGVDPKSGTFTLTDKETGVVYKNINQFRDMADAGDEYNYSPPETDLVVAKFFSDPQITIRKSALEQSIEIVSALDLPFALNPDRKSRQNSKTLCPLTTVVTLTKESRRVDFETVFLNKVDDHRLQVLFPAPFVTETSEAEGAFDVVSRPVALPKFDNKWIEDPMPQAPQKSFVFIGDNERKQGLTVMNRGLPEYEVIPPAPSGEGEEPNGSTVAVTLLRCVGWLSRDDFKTRRGHAGPGFPTPGAQEQGTHFFHYSIMPHKGDWLVSGSQQQAHGLNQPFIGMATPVQSGQLPPQLSFMEVMPRAIVLSTVKRSEDGKSLIVRLWNPAQRDIPLAKIRFYRQPAAISLVDLNETAIVGEVTAGEDGWFGFPLAAKKIATLRLDF